MALSYEETLSLLRADMQITALKMKTNAQFERINIEALKQYPLMVGEPSFGDPSTFDLAKMPNDVKIHANKRAAYIAKEKLKIFLQTDVPKQVLDIHRDLFEKSRAVLLDKAGLEYYLQNGCITADEKTKLETRLASYDTWLGLSMNDKAETLGLLYGVTEEGLVMLIEEQYESASEGFCFAFAPTVSGMWLSFQLLQNADGWVRFINFALTAPGIFGWIASYFGSIFGLPLVGTGLSWGLSKVQTLANAAFAPVQFIQFLLKQVLSPKEVALYIEKKLMRTNRVYGFMGSMLALSTPAILLFGRYQYAYLMENLTQGVGTQVAALIARSPSASAIITQAGSLVAGGVAMMFKSITTLFASAIAGSSPEIAALFAVVGSVGSIWATYSMFYALSRFQFSKYIGVGWRTAIAGTLGLGLLTYGAISLYPFIFSYYLTMPITMYLTSLVSQLAFVAIHYIRTGLTNYLLRYARTKASPAVAKRLVTWINRVGPVLDGLVYFAYYGLLFWNQGLRFADLYPLAVKYLPAWGKRLVPAGVADFINLGAGAAAPTAAGAFQKFGQEAIDDWGWKTAYDTAKPVFVGAAKGLGAAAPLVAGGASTLAGGASTLASGLSSLASKFHA